jgi:LEA14-like dessication related protein
MKNSYPTLLVVLALVFEACSTPKAIKIESAANFSIEPRSVSESRLSCMGYFSNPNPFSISVGQVEARILVDDAELATYKTDSLMRIPANAKAWALPLTISVQHFKLLSSLYQHLGTDSVGYTITGALQVGLKRPKRQIEFSQQGKISTKATLNLLRKQIKI